MSMYLNRWTGAGNLGKDPEFRMNNTGVAFVKFSIAITDWKKNKEGEGKTEHTEWIPIKAWGRLAENMDRWLKKGSNVYIEAKLRENKWKDKETGVDRYQMEVHAFHFQLLDRKNQIPPEFKDKTATVTPDKMKEDQNDFLGNEPYDSYKETPPNYSDQPGPPDDDLPF